MTQTALSGAFWPTLVIIVVSGLTLLAGESARLALRYERAGIEALELYRLLSGHLVHLGAGHFLLNAAGLLLVAFLVGAGLSAAAWWLVLGASIATIDLAFWFLNPTLIWYVGLSGVLHGMLVAGALVLFKQRPLESGVIVGLVVAKLAYEQLLGPLPGSETTSGGLVVIDAHLYGAIGGVLGVLILAGLRRPTSV
ncbi:MAG: rhombosortase [Woeseiaceae bacterium]|nr:rhombosortase [Woeseiaceae bacterium]